MVIRRLMVIVLAAVAFAIAAPASLNRSEAPLPELSKTPAKPVFPASQSRSSTPRTNATSEVVSSRDRALQRHEPGAGHVSDRGGARRLSVCDSRRRPVSTAGATARVNMTLSLGTLERVRQRRGGDRRRADPRRES